MVASHRLSIPSTRLSNSSSDKSIHYSISTCLSYLVFSGEYNCVATRLLKASHRCSMGFQSRQYAGKSIRVISSHSSSSWSAGVQYSRTLSYIKTKPAPNAIGKHEYREGSPVYNSDLQLQNICRKRLAHSAVQHYAFPDENSRTTLTIFSTMLLGWNCVPTSFQIIWYLD